MRGQFDKCLQVNTPVPEAPLPLSHRCVTAKGIATLISNTMGSFCLSPPLSSTDSGRKMVWDSFPTFLGSING